MVGLVELINNDEVLFKVFSTIREFFFKREPKVAKQNLLKILYSPDFNFINI